MSNHVDTGWKSVAEAGGSPSTPLPAPIAMRVRRATKQFTDKPISQEVLDELIELTTTSPSSFNLQDWRIVVVKSPEQRRALAAAAYGQSQVVTAPVTFVFAADTKAWSPEHLAPIFDEARRRGAWPDKVIDYYGNAIGAGQQALGEKQREYAVKDAMLAAAHLMIAASSLGIDSSPMNGWVEAEVKKVIGAGDNPDIAIACLVSVGYGAGGFGNPGRLGVGQTVFIDRLG